MKATRAFIPYVAAQAAEPSRARRRVYAHIFAAVLLLAASKSALTQGILAVTPTRSISTIAGSGTLGDGGNGGAANSATLADPSASAFDTAGNVYFADARNHLVREIVKATGIITVIAGTGIEGFGGDGASATSAFLDTPTGIAVDTSGNIYIADSHNHRIREITGGVITTIAGTGNPGFSGDGAAATLAQLYNPMSVAVDSHGNIFIADTRNQRIREVASGKISTIAGDGEQFFGGDGASATSAVLDSPTGVAVDAAGNLYVADRHNQRIRMISGTTISTIAGSGPASFAGGFSGDGTPATSALLSRPSGVSVDSNGYIYIADTNNQRIRELGGGSIATIVGSGQQGFGGDGTTPSSVNLNAPRDVSADVVGNLALTDRLNQRLRAATLPTLTFASDSVGILSPPQSITFTNVGTAPITVGSNTVSGPFAVVSGGTCAALPIMLAPSTSCTENISFLPIAVGNDAGSITVSGAGIVPQSVLLVGAAIPGSTSITLTSNINPDLITAPVVFTAVVSPTGSGTSTGTVTFYDGVTILGVQPLAPGSRTATLTDLALASGSHNITATYSGDTNFVSSTSNTLTETILDYNILLSPSSYGGSPAQSIAAGAAAVYTFNALPIGGNFNVPVQLTATGLPPGATLVLTPNSILIGTNTAPFTMSIQTASPFAFNHRPGLFGGSTAAFAVLLLPFFRSTRRRAQRLPPLYRCLLVLLSLGAVGGLAGCGTESGFFGETPQTYTITVMGTATADGVTLQRSSIVTLTVH